jgi:hypothetical protein
VDFIQPVIKYCSSANFFCEAPLVPLTVQLKAKYDSCSVKATLAPPDAQFLKTV